MSDGEAEMIFSSLATLRSYDQIVEVSSAVAGFPLKAALMLDRLATDPPASSSWWSDTPSQRVVSSLAGDQGVYRGDRTKPSAVRRELIIFLLGLEWSTLMAVGRSTSCRRDELLPPQDVPPVDRAASSAARAGTTPFGSILPDIRFTHHTLFPVFPFVFAFTFADRFRVGLRGCHFAGDGTRKHAVDAAGRQGDAGELV